MAGLGDFLNKAKELATDERIDQVSEQLQKLTPDAVDDKIRSVAEQAKKHN